MGEGPLSETSRLDVTSPWAAGRTQVGRPSAVVCGFRVVDDRRIAVALGAVRPSTLFVVGFHAVNLENHNADGRVSADQASEAHHDPFSTRKPDDQRGTSPSWLAIFDLDSA